MTIRSLSWRPLAEALLPAIGLLALTPALYRAIGLPALSLLPAAELWLMLWLGWRLQPGPGPRGRRALRLSAWSLLAAGLFQAALLLLVHGLAGPLRAWAPPLAQFDRPLARLALGTAGLTAGALLAWTLIAAWRRLHARLWRRFERRLQTNLAASFVLVAGLAILLAQLIPAGLLVAGLYLSLPAEAEAGLYARRIAAALARQPSEARRAAADRLFDALTSDALAHPAPISLEDRLLYTFRLPAGSTGRLIGAGWYSPQGRLATARGVLGPDLDLRRLPAGEAVWQSIGLTAAGGEEDVIANSRRFVSVSGAVYHIGAAPVKDATGGVLGVVVVWLEAATILGAAADLYTPLIAFAMIALLLTGVGALVLLPTGLAAAFLGRRAAARLVQPLQALGAAAAAMSAGDLGVRAAVSRPDELGDLARQFNRMAGRLQATLDALQDEKDKVTNLARARQEMVANVSHDLRTPLASLTAYLESLEGHPDRLAGYLPVLRDETNRLARLVDDLFALARLDAGEVELHLGPVDLKPLLSKIVAGDAPLAWERRRVVVQANLPDGLPPVLADGQRVEQILDNLLANALRHTPEGGVITISARPAPAAPVANRRDRPAVQVCVADTGAGIAAGDLPHVFERFYRADPARSGGGAGLGLAIVKALVEAQAGQVGVESAPGQGTSVWFTLPQCSEPLSTPSA